MIMVVLIQKNQQSGKTTYNKSFLTNTFINFLCASTFQGPSGKLLSPSINPLHFISVIQTQFCSHFVTEKMETRRTSEKFLGDFLSRNPVKWLLRRTCLSYIDGTCSTPKTITKDYKNHVTLTWFFVQLNQAYCHTFTQDKSENLVPHSLILLQGF